MVRLEKPLQVELAPVSANRVLDPWDLADIPDRQTFPPGARLGRFDPGLVVLGIRVDFGSRQGLFP